MQNNQNKEKGQVAERVKEFAINKKRLLRLFKKGEGDYWKLIVTFLREP